MPWIRGPRPATPGSTGRALAIAHVPGVGGHAFVAALPPVQFGHPHQRATDIAAMARFHGLLPLEAKASGTNARASKWSAAWQLVSYWKTLQSCGGKGLGVGCIALVSDVRKGDRAVDLHLLVPESDAAFAAALASLAQTDVCTGGGGVREPFSR